VPERLLQDAGGVAVVVAEDYATRWRFGVSGDSCAFQGGGVDPDHVAGEVLQHHRHV
jgi:hypothetical protein